MRLKWPFVSAINVYIDTSLGLVRKRLTECATEPIKMAVSMALKANPGLSGISQLHSWFDKLSTLSKESQVLGKRFRAKIAIISSNIFGIDENTASSLGAFVELVQTASLVHDDVVDEALMRRGKPTINNLNGNRFAVLTGDYILSLALSELHKIGSFDLLTEFSNIVSEMTLGEAMEIETNFKPKRTREHYLSTISLKTASLMSFCAFCAPVYAKSGQQHISALAEYGFNLGMAFQIVDDVLDFVGPDGKEPGQDLKEGIVTLPLILCGCSDCFKASWDEVIAEIGKHNALEKSIELASFYSSNAVKSIANYKSSSNGGFQALIDTNTGIYDRLPDNLRAIAKEQICQA